MAGACRYALAAALLVTTGPIVALGARAATRDEARPVAAAVAHMASRGVTLEMPRVRVVTAGEAARLVPGDWYAAAGAGVVYLRAGMSSGGFRSVGRVLRLGTRASRRTAFERCDVCAGVVDATIHELVHATRLGRGLWRGRPFEEGLADAIAADEAPLLCRSTLGGASCPASPPAYPGWTATVRALSAARTGSPWRSPEARRWRLARLVADAG